MDPIRYEIETADEEAKSRSFGALLLAHLSWSRFKLGKTPYPTPLFLALAGSTGELRPFLANLQSGVVAQRPYRPGAWDPDHPPVLNLSDRGVHRRTLQRVGDDLIATLFVPTFFALDPAPGAPCQFVFAPPRSWLDTEARRLAEAGFENPLELAEARYLTAFVDRRTQFPIPPLPELHRALFRTLRVAGHAAEEGSEISSLGFPELGYRRPLVVDIDAAALEELLRDLLATHLPKDTYDGATRLAAGGWVLPDPAHALAGAGLRF